MHERYIKGYHKLYSFLPNREHYYSQIQYECSWHQPPFIPVASNDQHEYLSLFLCHGHGRMSWTQHTNNSCDFNGDFWEDKQGVHGTHSHRQIFTWAATLLFPQTLKRKVLTDLLEVTLVFPPPVHSYCRRMRHLSTQWETTLPFRAKAVFCCVRDMRSTYGSLSISWLSSFPEHWSFLPREPTLGSLSFQQK